MNGEGYFLNAEESGRHRQEAAVLSCAHCQKVLFLHDVPGQVNWRQDGGWCRREMKPLCGPCADRALTFGCEPFIKQIEQTANLRVRLEQFHKLAGLDPPPPARQIVTST